MKSILIGIISIVTLTLNAQNMTDPIHTVVGLFIATDQKDWKQVEQLFYDEVLLDYSSMNGNRPSKVTPVQIVSAWKGILPGFEHTHHQLGNFTSVIHENKAKVFCYGTASHYLSDDNGNLWSVVGTYDFELTRLESSSWKITAMKFNFKFQDGNTLLPKKAMENLK